MATVYEIITDRIIKQLEKGTVPWQRPWNVHRIPGYRDGLPRNLMSKKEYRGVNVFLLHAQGYGSPWWLTFKQAQERGGNVKKGEHGTPVVFWKWLEKENEEDPENPDRIPLLRYYTVFNLMQCEVIEAPPTDEPEITGGPQPDEFAEAVVENMPRRPAITRHGARAFYRPSTDEVCVPPLCSYDIQAEFYSTLFHELVHSTGHESRLNRRAQEGARSFGDETYSKEELVAEMGAAFLCNHCGTLEDTIQNSAAYIQSWLRVFKNDPKMVVVAAAQAQKASDFILGKHYHDGTRNGTAISGKNIQLPSN